MADISQVPKLLSKDNAFVLDCRGSHLCGYCSIPKNEIPGEWQGDYDADALQYLKIHGGITYCHVDGEMVVFGFDCAHAGDEGRLDLKDPKIVLEHAITMEKMIRAYAARIDEWRSASKEKRCEIIDEINKMSTETDLGFGAMIDLLCGGEKITGGQS